MNNPEIDIDGNKYWKNNKGQYHREDGPAIKFVNGAKFWYRNGLRHRTDGPAVENANEDKFWYLNGKYHRVDGPAIEYADDSKSWYLNDLRHRLDGPALEWNNKSNFSNRKIEWQIIFLNINTINNLLYALKIKL